MQVERGTGVDKFSGPDASLVNGRLPLPARGD